MATFYLPGADSGYSSDTNVRYRIKVVEGAISGRTRSLTVSVEYWRTDANTGYTSAGNGTCYCKIDGTEYTQTFTSSQRVTYNSYTPLFQKTISVSYDVNGGKSLAVSAYSYAPDSNNISSSGYQGGTIQLSNIGKQTYTVAYNANGGTGVPANQTKTHGTALTLSSTKPTRTGYTFKNWNTAANGSGTSYASGASYTGNAALTLYAQWTINTYTVSYNANGGTGAPGNQTKTYGTTLTLSSTKPTRDKYNFLGWGTSASSTTVSYAAGGSYTANAAITLYAIWEVAYVEPRINDFEVKRVEKAEAGSGPINQVPISIDTNGSIFNGTGYREGYRLSSSGGLSALTNSVATGFIPAKPGDIVTMSGVSWPTSNGYTYFVMYDANFTKVAHINRETSYVNSNGWSYFANVNESETTVTIDSDNVTTFNISTTMDYAYVRISAIGSGANMVVNVTSTTSGGDEEESGTVSDAGTYFQTSFDWATDEALQSITVKYKPSTSSTWTTNTISDSGTSGSVSKLFGPISVENGYDIQVTVADASGSTTVTGFVPGKAYTIDCKRGGKGVAFGKPAETEDLFEVDWDAQFNKTLKVNGRNIDGHWDSLAGRPGNLVRYQWLANAATYAKGATITFNQDPTKYAAIFVRLDWGGVAVGVVSGNVGSRGFVLEATSVSSTNVKLNVIVLGETDDALVWKITGMYRILNNGSALSLPALESLNIGPIFGLEALS